MQASVASGNDEVLADRPMRTASTATWVGIGTGAEAPEALADFRRFGAWMWRNADVLDFVG